MLKLVLLSVLFIVIAAQKPGRCPKVKDLYCSDKQNGPNCKYQAYIELRNGKRCPACKICEPGRNLKKCPLYACPLWLHPPGCERKAYKQKFRLKNGKICTACDTFVCPRRKP